MEPSQYPAHFAEPRIVYGSPGGGFVRGWHGSELVNREQYAVLADPGLAVEERAPVAEQVDDRHDGHHHARASIPTRATTRSKNRLLRA